MPSFTFAASVNAILYVGASPVFVDIEPEQYTLDPEDTARRVTARTRAIMAVDTPPTHLQPYVCERLGTGPGIVLHPRGY